VATSIKGNRNRKESREGNFDPGRRKFAQWALAGTLGSAAFASSRLSAAPALPGVPAGIKIALQLGPDPSDDDLRFANQLGVEFVTIWLHADLATSDNFVRLRRRVEDAGLKVWNIGNLNVHNMGEVTLNLPGREQKIEEYKAYLRNLGKAGVHYTTFAYMANGIWSSAPETTRGGASARAFDVAKGPAGYWDQRVFHGPLTHGRAYSEQELWDNYTYFIKAVVPVAEETGVRIGIHPDDPPMPVLGGIPRCIFGNFDGYQRALEIANSPNIGMCLCCGTWLEGGKYTRRSLLETIQYFGPRGKIFKVHFRNVNAPLPHFVETFIDNGYMDMYKVMRTLREVNFNGVMIPDHVPGMIGDRAGTAYSIAYMKAYRERANQETVT
jgi:mannonate dehydratase